MANEEVLRKILGENVRCLQFCANGLDVNVSFSHVFTKVMITDVYVLCPRTHLGQVAELESSRIVFEGLAVYNRRRAEHLESSVLKLEGELHYGDDVS